MAGTGIRVTVIRWQFRIFHVFLILGSAFLLYSALGADDDTRIISSAWNLFLLHRYIGLLWGALILIYSIYSVARRRSFGILEPLKKPVIEQITESFSIIGRYFFGRRISENVRRKMGRHNVLASYAFILLVLGLLALGFGGMGLIISPHETGLYEVYLGIHVLGAGMLALFVLAHGFAVINRANRPLLRAVFSDGKVGKDWMDEAMPSHTEE